MKIIQRTDKTRKNGEAPLYILVTENRKRRQISLKRYVRPEHWDEDRQMIKSGHPNSQRLNNFLRNEVAKLDDELLKNEKSSGLSLSKMLDKGGKADFIEYSHNLIDERFKHMSPGTLNGVKAVVSKVEKYLNGSKLTFNELDHRWLKRYENYLRNDLSNSQNTIKTNMKRLQRITNQAVEDGVIKYENNPFLRYKCNWEPTLKEYLTEEELSQLENLELPTNSHLQLTRDMYIFACYCGGIRISDILLLKNKDYDGERLAIRTKKTKTPLYIKVPDKARLLIDKYSQGKKKGEFVFPALKIATDEADDRVIHQAISSQNALANKELKIMAARAGIEKNLHFHTSRHTWATRALRLGIPIEYVSKLMGHNSIRTTQVYAKIVNEELDKAMDKFNM